MEDNFNIYIKIYSKYLKFNKLKYQEPIIIEIRKSNIDLLLNKYKTFNNKLENRKLLIFKTNWFFLWYTLLDENKEKKFYIIVD